MRSRIDRIRLEELRTESTLIRPHNLSTLHIGLIGTGDGDHDFRVLIKLEGFWAKDEGAFFANIFDGALEVKTVDGKRDLPTADCSFNFPLVIHTVTIDAVAKNLNLIIHFFRL